MMPRPPMTPEERTAILQANTQAEWERHQAAHRPDSLNGDGAGNLAIETEAERAKPEEEDQELPPIDWNHLKPYDDEHLAMLNGGDARAGYGNHLDGVFADVDAKAVAAGGPVKALPAPFARIINPADWEGLPIPDRKWIVPGYVPHMTVTMLSGDGGQGKSLLALQLAAAMALAKDWLGLLPEPGRTLVLSAEDDGDEMQRRLDWIRKFHGAAWADLADIRLIDLAGENSALGALTKGQIEPTEMYRTLDAFMAEWKPSLTTLDVLADMFAGQENDRSQVRQFINLLKGLARKHRSAILLLAHPSLTGMNSGTGLSGSTDWNNGVRSRLYFQTPKTDSGEPLNKNLRTLEGMKSNYGERGGKIDLEWKNGLFVPVSVHGGFDKMAADAKEDDVFMRILKRFNVDNRNAAEKSGTSYAPTLFAEQPDAEAVTVKQFKGAMNRLLNAKKIRIVNNGTRNRPSRTFVPTDEWMAENCTHDQGA